MYSLTFCVRVMSPGQNATTGSP